MLAPSPDSSPRFIIQLVAREVDTEAILKTQEPGCQVFHPDGFKASLKSLFRQVELTGWLPVRADSSHSI